LCYILKKLKFILSKSHSIHYNLALEQYLLENEVDDVLLWYRNTSCVVMGKHQNPWLEVNFNQPKSQMTIARRMTGGGTVYHDLGNLNFSFIRNKTNDFVNFREHIEPISDTLSLLGIENHISPRNDIFMGKYKISGNAEHVSATAKKIIHHGTLLYDADINSLTKNIKPDGSIVLKTHAVNSVRSPVMNIKEEKDFGDTDSFLHLLVEKLHSTIGENYLITLTPEDLPEIIKLVEEKYLTWEWIFAQTPQFSYFPNKSIEITVRKGRIKSCESKDGDCNRWLGLPICNILSQKPENILLDDWSEYQDICLPYWI